MKNILHSSCDIEYFVETHHCKLCVILRSRVLRVVCPHIEDIGRRLPSCNYSVSIRVNRVMFVSLFAETIKPVSVGDKI